MYSRTWQCLFFRWSCFFLLFSSEFLLDTDIFKTVRVGESSATIEKNWWNREEWRRLNFSQNQEIDSGGKRKKKPKTRSSFFHVLKYYCFSIEKGVMECEQFDAVYIYFNFIPCSWYITLLQMGFPLVDFIFCSFLFVVCERGN